jgi:hypothetical protein
MHSATSLEGAKMPARKTRRDFLRGTAGAATAVVVGGGVTAAAAGGGQEDTAYPDPDAIYPDPNQPWGDPLKRAIIRPLRRVVDANTLEVDDGATSIRVRVRADASIRTDQAASLNDFVPGEALAIEAVDGPNGFEATAVWCALTAVWTRVESREGDRLETAAGPIVLTPRTVYGAFNNASAGATAQDVRAGLTIAAEVRKIAGAAPVAHIVKLLDR